MRTKLLALLALSVLAAVALTACGGSRADTVSHNLSKAADQFEIQRRIVFYDGVNGTNILVMEGACSLGNNDSAGRLSVTCQIGPDQYIKNFLGLSDNVTFFAEQLETADVNPYRYKRIFRPSTLIPDIDLDLGGADANAVQQ